MNTKTRGIDVISVLIFPNKLPQTFKEWSSILMLMDPKELAEALSYPDWVQQ